MNDEFNDIITNLINNDKVLQMKEYRQHFDNSCFDHCYDVARVSYKVAKIFHFDYVSLTRAAMLHDLFLYDWHKKDGRKGFHAFSHGKLAANNASLLFDLTEKEKDMIEKHMWPVTLSLPRSKEGFLLTFVDKYCAIKEICSYLARFSFNNKILKYFVLLLLLLK